MIEHAIVYGCDICGATVEERHRHPIGEEYKPTLRFPSLPEGWRVIQRTLYCPRHDVVLTVSTREEACTS